MVCRCLSSTSAPKKLPAEDFRIAEILKDEVQGVSGCWSLLGTAQALWGKPGKQGSGWQEDRGRTQRARLGGETQPGKMARAL